MESRRIEDLDLIGGDPALDFVNTLGGVREGPWDDEWLHGYGDLARWSRHAGLLEESLVARLLERAAAAPAEAARVHAGAIVLREALYRVLAGTHDDLEVVAAAYREALGHARLAPAGRWTWEGVDLRRPLWAVADAAVELLRSDRVDRLRQCGHCRWLFLDASKNRSRRWCSMAHCGSDAKVRLARERRSSR